MPPVDQDSPPATPVQPPPVHYPWTDSASSFSEDSRDSLAVIVDRWFTPIAFSLCAVIAICAAQLAVRLDRVDDSSVAQAATTLPATDQKPNLPLAPTTVSLSIEQAPSVGPEFVFADNTNLRLMVSAKSSHEIDKSLAANSTNPFIDAFAPDQITSEPSDYFQTKSAIEKLTVDQEIVASVEPRRSNQPPVASMSFGCAAGLANEPKPPAVVKGSFNPIRTTGPAVASAKEPAQCADGACEQRKLGTSIQWAESPAEAYRLAAEQDKLVYLIHVSGNFEIPGFT